MIGVLLRKDPAVRMLPWMAVGGAGIGALAVVMVGNVVDTGDEIWRELGSTLVVAPLLQALVVAWFTASGGWGAVRERAAELQLVLPVPLRTWIALRAVALLLIGWLPLLLVGGALFVAVDAPWRAKATGKSAAAASHSNSVGRRAPAQRANASAS
jgi:hypothetical protein